MRPGSCRVENSFHAGGEHETMATFRFRNQAIADCDLLPPEPVERKAAPRKLRACDVIDADFVEMADPRPRAQRFRYNDNTPQRKKTPAASALEQAVAQAVAAVARAERNLRDLSGRRFSAVVAMFAAVFFLLAGGLAGIAGASAPGPRDANPLDISHVTLSAEGSGGLGVLAVRGIIENHGGGRVAVPAIRADILSGERLVASIVIDPPVQMIFSGHSRGFSARLPHPGGKDPQIRLSFVTAAVAHP